MIIIFPGASIADDLVGFITMPDNEIRDLAKFKVEHTEEKCQIDMFYGENRYTFKNIEKEGKELNFDLDTGSKYQCKIIASDNHISGKCFDHKNSERYITLEIESDTEICGPQQKSEQPPTDDIELTNITATTSSIETSTESKTDTDSSIEAEIEAE